VTVPDNFVTAWHALTTDFGLQLPYPKPDAYTPPEAEAPFLIWGGATSAGQFAIQLLRFYGYKNIVAIASRKNHQGLRELGAHAVADYNDADVVEQLQKIISGAPSARIYDCVGSLSGSIAPIAKVAQAGSVVAVLLPVIVRDASETEAPEYAMDAQSVAPWKPGVVVRGVRTHSYLEVWHFLLRMGSSVS
jgi:NADPH:quinone reductase-like Zn-dependent oxidoreductase